MAWQIAQINQARPWFVKRETAFLKTVLKRGFCQPTEPSLNETPVKIWNDHAWLIHTELLDFCKLLMYCNIFNKLLGFSEIRPKRNTNDIHFRDSVRFFIWVIAKKDGEAVFFFTLLSFSIPFPFRKPLADER